jgi:toxin ParE1/3/4
MATVRKTITLTIQQDAWIAAQIEAGYYTNDSEAIRDLIRREQERNGELEAVGNPSRSISIASSSANQRNMAEFRLSRKAQRDLDEVFDYTVAQWDLPQALRYTDMIQAACAALAEAPNKGQDCGYIRAGYRRLRVEQHVIYFRTATYGIAVIRILHQPMDAPRHL